MKRDQAQPSAVQKTATGRTSAETSDHAWTRRQFLGAAAATAAVVAGSPASAQEGGASSPPAAPDANASWAVDLAGTRGCVERSQHGTTASTIGLLPMPPLERAL